MDDLGVALGKPPYHLYSRSEQHCHSETWVGISYYFLTKLVAVQIHFHGHITLSSRGHIRLIR